MTMLRSEQTTLLLEQDRRVLNPSEVNLAATLLDQNCRTLLLIAPTSGCGTTTCALSMARQLAGSVKGKLLLVDAGPSATGLSSRLGMAADRGLFELLQSQHPEGELRHCIQRHPELPFDLLPLGQPSVAAGRLTAEDLQYLFDCLAARYRFVVIDAEAVYGGSSGLILAAMADAVALVVRAEETRWEVAQAAVQRLRQANARLLGSVLNARRLYLPKWLYRLL
ncbi:exopolysaccharide biosynthesis protein [Azotobacter vinelandii CA]|uniref:Exopolysaccharide biosynthesis protein n=2 Tax=Azotobacter vinelandii TaxID=354 RepID=C1DKC9_AZOVD|nr:CpsD/CapB family tyrosine-protein kinase [Azotobacter vinelandii]ACO76792.1 exopolysaccharide biosynthesis protein [Azotobacter vinelandii DJ]AGK17255.1 exopolysaccharide biosynthesis protein [Azotobacter vinelandii CA]AGK19374.1 exopolysaccharide biosynthesis protein [Azotobacter vinelandii CA6]WKN22552.1 CpsD/CapB family tyrosine-protein kinase [Azotobacter vinelandii]SFX67700.1 Chromosome partitioning ATPase, Mrp family, contains Fe-S cluster [Azotobacter vinelandii]